MVEKEVNLYKVTDVVRRTSINKAGEIEEFYEVYFQTKSGKISSILVPITATQEDIQKAVKKEASKIEDVMKLME